MEQLQLDRAPILGTEELSEEDIQRLRQLGIQDLFFFTRGILRYGDVNPRVHRGMCTFLTEDPSLRKLVLAPRSHFKTTIGQANQLRKICKNPNIRILLANATANNASAMLGEIKQHITQNETFRAIYSYVIPKNTNATTWSQTEILLPRTLIASEPTIQATGVGAEVVSRHFNLLDFDDLIGEEALHSPTVMRRAIDWLNHSVSLLISPDQDEMNIRGTRWAYNDLYNHAIENLGFKVYRLKAIVYNPETDRIEPLFNQRFSMEFFAGIMQADPAQWAAQYANDPSDVAFADFQKQWLRFYKVAPDGDLRWVDNDGQLNIQKTKDLFIYTHVDPSMGDTPNADMCAVMTVGVNALGQVFLLDAWQRRVDPLMLLDKIFEIHDRFQPKVVSIEATAFQKSLVYYMEKEQRRRGVYMRVEPFKPSNRKSKEARIRGALQPYFSSGQVFVREQQLDFVEQYMAFGRTDEDHMMDALAQGPTFWKAPKDDVQLQRHVKQRDQLLGRGPSFGCYGITIPLHGRAGGETGTIFTQ